MSMTGLTSGQAAFGGVAPTPGQSPPDLITAQDRAKELIDRTYRTVLNRNPTQVGDFYLPKILSGELHITGAYGAPTPRIFANSPLKTLVQTHSLVYPSNRCLWSANTYISCYTDPEQLDNIAIESKTQISRIGDPRFNRHQASGWIQSVGPEGGNPGSVRELESWDAW
jgi:hypothetical protein